MKFLGYMISYSLVWLLHLLPERLLYLFSDLLCFLTFRVARYRRSVVMGNLTRVFPDRGQREIRQLAGGFYHHLCDVLLESAVNHFYTREKALSKITYKNPEVLNDLTGSGKMVMAVTAHYGNWEYLNTIGLVTKEPVLAIYKPLRNKYFDSLIRSNRNRFGVVPIAMEQIARQLISHQRENRPVTTLFLSDQRPMFHQIQYWTDFLGQDTPLYLGTEKLARKLNAAVVFLKIRKTKRGRYEVEAEEICRDPGAMDPYGITERHVRILENLIREQPEFWLWSHRRWKHSRESVEGSVPVTE